MDKKDNTTMVLVVNRDNNSREFYFRTYDTKEEFPVFIPYVRDGKFLYAYEARGKVFIGLATAKDLADKIDAADGKVGLLGPIRDSERVVYEIESFLHDFRDETEPNAYDFKRLEEFTGNPNASDVTEKFALFQIIQDTFQNGWKGSDNVLHSLGNGNEVVRDLIIPDKHARITVVVFETVDGVLKGEESTAVV